MKLHHVGIVVPKISDSIGEITKYIKFDTVSQIMPVGSRKVNICFLKVGEPFIELIESTEGNSPISEFAKSGGGIHHLCFEVKDIYEKIDEMTKMGATLLVSPVTGFDERRIAFLDLNMKNTKCGLIELLEIKA